MSDGYWHDLRHHLGEERESRVWLSEPLVRRRVNARVAGDPDRWPTDWLRDRLAPHLPFGRALTVGRGAGALERDLCRRGSCATSSVSTWPPQWSPSPRPSAAAHSAPNRRIFSASTIARVISSWTSKMSFISRS